MAQKTTVSFYRAKHAGKNNLLNVKRKQLTSFFLKFAEPFQENGQAVKTKNKKHCWQKISYQTLYPPCA